MIRFIIGWIMLFGSVGSLDIGGNLFMGISLALSGIAFILWALPKLMAEWELI